MSSAPPPNTAMATVFSERRSDLVVTARDVRADGVISVTLADPGGGQLPAWTPGAHIDVLLDDGLVRQYSLCGAPADQHSWRLGVLLDGAGRGGSRRVHETLHVGSTVAVRGPRNHFPLHASDRYLFVAGGIGITPILPMIATADAAGAEWQLWYGGRTRASMAFQDELERYGDRVTLWPDDERGLLPLAEILGTPQDGTLIYCCGPEGLLSAVENGSSAWPAGSLHLERFSAKPVEEPAGGPAGFEVVCQRSGVTVAVPPDKSIIDALEANGISVLSSCQEGVCGTCETAVLEGLPDHRDSLLSEDERESNEYMMICVSRALSDRLVLDL